MAQAGHQQQVLLPGQQVVHRQELARDADRLPDVAAIALPIASPSLVTAGHEHRRTGLHAGFTAVPATPMLSFMTEGHEPAAPDARVENDMSGKVSGHAVQAGNVGGNIHIGDVHMPPRTVNRKVVAISVAAVVVVAVGAGVTGAILFNGNHNSGHPAPSTNVVPASTTSPPVLVEHVSPISSNINTHDFVLPDPLSLSPTDLSGFKDIYRDSHRYESWFTEHKGAALGMGVITVALRGNADDKVQIVNVKVMKNCAKPYDGTYFRGYSQGSGDTVKVAFDLDSPSPVAQEMAWTSTKGLFPTGNEFFSVRDFTLNPGETQTRVVGAYTKQYSCTFTLQLIVATPDGTFSEDISDGGKPFAVTAVAPSGDKTLAGYHNVYVYNEGITWEAADPKTLPAPVS
jgi:hypothetical protein